MIKLDRICVWLFLINFMMIALNGLYCSLLDEACCYAMGAAALADCVFNGNWRRYKLLGIIIGVIAFYAVNSILFRHYNTPKYIIDDALMMLKPFFPLCVFMSMAIVFTPAERQITRWICWFHIALIVFGICIGTMWAERLIYSHIMYLGVTALTTAIVYLWTSIRSDGTVAQRDLLVVIAVLILGLYSMRSKYYGQFITMMFFLFIYRKGIISHLSPRNIVIIVATVVVMIIAVWDKFSLYYLTPDTAGAEVHESIARAALMYGMVMSISQYPLFGAGLASFGTTPSVNNYSTFYIEHDLDKVYGLSPSYHSFVSDSFFATYGGEFGLVGLTLIIGLFVMLYRKMLIFVNIDYSRYRYQFIVGAVIIISIWIENSNGNMVSVPGGLVMLSVLGMLTAQANGLKAQPTDADAATDPDSPQQAETPCASTSPTI